LIVEGIQKGNQIATPTSIARNATLLANRRVQPTGYAGAVFSAFGVRLARHVIILCYLVPPSADAGH